MGCAVSSSVGRRPERVSDFQTISGRYSTTIQDNSALTTANLSGTDKLYLTEESFNVEHLIDTGGFGFVFKATRIATRRTYALKVEFKPMHHMNIELTSSENKTISLQRTLCIVA